MFGLMDDLLDICSRRYFCLIYDWLFRLPAPCPIFIPSASPIFETYRSSKRSYEGNYSPVSM